MTLPASGQLSFSQVNTELTLSSTATISLNTAAVRTLAAVLSGTISFSNLHGKSYDITRGIFGGGGPGDYTNVIDYITVATNGNGTDFGDLSMSIIRLSACSSSTRGIFLGGYYYDGDPVTSCKNHIDYITIATTGNASDFGDLTVGKHMASACSSSTRGVSGGGQQAGSYWNIIDYITIATTGNASDFGDLTVIRLGLAACSSSTRGVFAGGQNGPVYDVIDYITIATASNASNFGTLTVIKKNHGACSSPIRGVFGGGSITSYQNNIDYITIATTGNASDFGDLTANTNLLAACSSPIKAVFGGGYTDVTHTSVTQQVTMATTGNASNFGNLTSVRSELAALSNGHGGLS